MSFYHTWRKRLACERCRHLKVRCEYKSPTSDTCIRCEKSNTPCVVPNIKKKDGDDSGNKRRGGDSQSVDETESKEHLAVYLQKIMKDAEDKLAELEVSPLAQAIAAGLYTVAEAEEYYKQVRESLCVFPPIKILKLPDSIMEVDKQWPSIAISIVTVKALNGVGKSVADVQYYVRGLYRNDVETHDSHVALDRQLGFAFICQFALCYRNNNLSALLTLHGMSLTTIRLLERDSQCEHARLALSTAILTILPYTSTTAFRSLSPLVAYYRTQTYASSGATFDMDPHSQCDCIEHQIKLPGAFAAEAMMEMTLAYNRADTNLCATSSADEVAQLILITLQSITQSENEFCVAYNDFCKQFGVEYSMKSALPAAEDLQLSPFLSTFLIAKLNILHKAAIRLLDISSCTNFPAYNVIQGLITQTATFCGQLFRALAHVDASQPLLPSSMLYHIPSALMYLQTMRFIAFAGGIDIDVRSDCLLNVVLMKWEELVRSSILMRLHFNLIFQPLDMAAVKIGQLDPKTENVFGPGSMPNFEIIYFDGNTKNVREKFTMSSEKLLELLIETAADGQLQKNPRDWFEQTRKHTLPTVLKLLFHYA